MSSNSTTKTLAITVLVLIVVGLLVRFVFFRDGIDKRSSDMKNLGQREQDYKVQNPNATKKDIDAAFDKNMNALLKWKTDYLKQNPGATDAQADAARNAARGK